MPGRIVLVRASDNWPRCRRFQLLERQRQHSTRAHRAQNDDTPATHFVRRLHTRAHFVKQVPILPLLLLLLLLLSLLLSYRIVFVAVQVEDYAPKYALVPRFLNAQLKLLLK